MSKMLQLLVGLILIIFLPFWLFVISPRLLKLPVDFSSSANMIHTENDRFNIGSAWVGKTIALSSSNIKTFEASGNKSILQTRFRVESLVGETLFELNQTFTVDRQTRHDLPRENDKFGTSYILFPLGINQKPINFWSIEMGSPTLLKYVDSKLIQQLNTLHFHVDNYVIDDTSGYDFLPLVPEKYNVLSNVSVDIYVEPITGIIIDRQDTGISYYTDKNGNHLWDIAQWSNKYDDPTITARVTEAKLKKSSYLQITTVIPIFTTIVGLILIFSSLLQRKKNQKSKNRK